MISSRIKDAYEEGERLESAFSLIARKTVTKKMLQANRSILELLGGKQDDQVFYLSSHEEVLLRVLYEVLIPVCQRTGKNEILVPKGESHSICRVIKTAGRLGIKFKEVEVDGNGRVTEETLNKARSARTVAFFLSWTEQYTGAIHPMFELATLCKREDIFLYVDGTDSVGKVFFRCQDIAIDVLSFTRGRATAVIAKKPKVMIQGAWGKDFCLKEFFAMTAFAGDALSAMDINPLEYSQIKNEVMDRVEKAPIKCHFYNKGGHHLYDRWCFAFEGVKAENLAYFLREKNIFVEYLHVEEALKNRGATDGNLKGALSLKFSTMTAKIQIFQMWEKIVDTAMNVKEYSND